MGTQRGGQKLGPARARTANVVDPCARAVAAAAVPSSALKLLTQHAMERVGFGWDFSIFFLIDYLL